MPDLSQFSSGIMPFLVLGVVVLLYFVGGKAKEGMQAAMRRDVNFYLVCVLAVAIVSVVASTRYDRDWLDMAVWLLGAVAIGAVVWRFKVTVPGGDGARGGEDDRGVL